MAFVDLTLPDGIYRGGTEYSSKDRWYDADLVRFRDGVKQPVGGWRRRSNDTVDGVARAAHSWVDKQKRGWIGIGTNEGLFLQSRSGVVYDITPAGFAAGRPDALQGGGFGTGGWSRYTFGTRRPDVKGILPANTWDLDNWGENLVGIFDTGTKPYEWVLADGESVVAQEITPAPSGIGMVVTDERFMMVIGAVYDTPPVGVDAGGPFRVAWSDRENNQEWAVNDPTKESGFLDLQAKSALQAIVKVRGGVLVLSSTEAFFGRYIDTEYAYGFQRVGEACGVIGRKAVCVINGIAYWRGVNGFYAFDGYVRSLPCSVWEFAKESLNVTQSSKFWAMGNSSFDEVWWFDVTGANSEINRYFYYNTTDNHWCVGTISRTCGIDTGVFVPPIMMSADGYTYEHETGLNYDGRLPYLESGPLELGVGQNTLTVKTYIPDERTSGQVNLYLKGRWYPNTEQFQRGPFAAASPKGVQFNARQVSARFEGVAFEDFRIGTMRFDVIPRGRR